MLMVKQALSTSEAFSCVGAGVLVFAHGLGQGGNFDRRVDKLLRVSMLAPPVTDESPNWNLDLFWYRSGERRVIPNMKFAIRSLMQ